MWFDGLMTGLDGFKSLTEGCYTVQSGWAGDGWLGAAGDTEPIVAAAGAVGYGGIPGCGTGVPAD